MRVCGLDVATKTGWCIATGRNYQTGRFDSAKVGKRKVSCDAERNANFRQWLWTTLITNEVQVVAIERRAVSNMTRTTKDEKTGETIEVPATTDATAAALAYLNNCAQEVCFSLNIPFHIVAVNSWRSVFLPGQKGEDREHWKQLAKDMCTLMQIEARSKDAAEAVGITYWLQKQMNLQRAQAPAGGLFAMGEAA